MSTIIASLGDHRTYVTLTVDRVGAGFELVSTMFVKNIELELARETADDEDTALDFATDLEWKAQDEMVAMDIDYEKTSGWPEALERHFAQSRHTAIAAE